jgi:hypothetical protein
MDAGSRFSRGIKIQLGVSGMEVLCSMFYLGRLRFGRIPRVFFAFAYAITCILRPKVMAGHVCGRPILQECASGLPSNLVIIFAFLRSVSRPGPMIVVLVLQQRKFRQAFVTQARVSADQDG